MSLYQKKVSVGAFAKKGEDYKDGDIITIANEGKEIDGQFGKQDVFLVKLPNGEEKNLSFNQTSINSLIDGYGPDSKNWIGKKAKIWLILMSVSGKMVRVTFVTHPDAQLDEESQTFVLPNKKSAPDPENTEVEVNPDEIPF